MELAGWTLTRERAALGRVRTMGMCLAAVLLALGAWLGCREAKLAPLPGYARAAVAAEEVITTRLGLKMFSLAVYTAKLRRNSLLVDITGKFDLSAPCIQMKNLHGLEDSSPCAAQWDDALTSIWKAAYGAGAPPIPAELRRDLWGSPYLLDQSEVVCGLFGEWCPHDVISSAGPDAAPNTDDDIRETTPQHLGPSRIKTP